MVKSRKGKRHSNRNVKKRVWFELDRQFQQCKEEGSETKLQAFLLKLKRWMWNACNGRAGLWLQTKPSQEWLKRTMPFKTWDVRVEGPNRRTGGRFAACRRRAALARRGNLCTCSTVRFAEGA